MENIGTKADFLNFNNVEGGKAQQTKCLLNSGYNNKASVAYSTHSNNTVAFSSMTHLWQ